MHKQTKILTGDGLSIFSTWLDIIAVLTIAAYTFNVAPYEMAVISAASLLPGILAAKIIGKVVDSHNPLLLIRLSIVLRIAATILIVLTQNLWVFAVAVAARSVFSSFTLPAINVLVQRNVKADDQNRYFSKLSLINGMSKIGAPMLGAMASGLLSITLPLYISCALGLLALFFFTNDLSTVTPDPTLEENKPGVNPPSVALENETADELVFLSCVAVYFSFVFMVNNLLPVILNDLNHGRSTLGLLIGCSGAGNVLASLYLSKKSRSVLQGGLFAMIKPALATAVCFSLIGLLITAHSGVSYWALFALFALIGTFSASFSISVNNFLFSKLKNNIGESSAKLQAAQNVAILISPLVGAYILERSSPSYLFFIASAFAIGFLIVLCAVEIRRNRPEAIAVEGDSEGTV